MSQDSLLKIEETFGDISSESLLSLVRVAEASERYADMCKFMQVLVTKKCEGDSASGLEVEERNLLSVAYKNVVGSKRSSWRTLASGALEETDPDLVEKYKKAVEMELNVICKEVLALLAKLNEFVKGKGDESEVFYLKMSGDYHRYLSEINDDDEDKNKTCEFYTLAMEVANAKLPETHPTRLGLALNFSVCYYEILKKPEEACALAKEAFDAAIEKLDTLNDASYKDSTLIMQLLRDNLTLWTSEPENQES